MRINVTRSSLPEMDEYIREIAPIWDSHWLTNMGEKHIALEAGLRDYFRCGEVCLFTNGHLALEGILSALDLHGEVITTPFTFASTTTAIVRCGLKPVFCDIDPVTFTLDPAKLEALITPDTCAILPVHVYGNLCNTEAIEAIAKKHGLKVIYDAAHAFGVTKNGVSAACFGDASMFSFHATKVFNTVEGGCVCCSDPVIRGKLDYIKNFGIPEADRIVYSGGNAKMSEFHAAMGICNLRHVEEWIEAREAIVRRYRENLSGFSELQLNPLQEGVRSNHAYFPVVFHGDRSRDAVADKLAENGIYARKYFYPLTNDNECFGSHGDETPIAKDISERVLTLPLYPELPLEDVDLICELITND